MKKLLYFAILVMTPTEYLSGQTLTIEDMVKNIRQLKDYKLIRTFVEKHGFDYDTALLPGAKGKMYSFMGDKEYKVLGLEQDTLKLRNAVFVRMEDDVTLRKLTVMTASKEYYEQLTAEMVKKKFKSIQHQDRNKPMSYTSELYPGIEVSISVVEAIKEEKPYARYQLSVVY